MMQEKNQLDRERQLAYLEQELTPKRLQHSLGVMQVMGELAKVYGLDQEKALTAGLLHDAAKDLVLARQIEIVEEANVEIRCECDNNFHNYLHGPVGAYIVNKELGINDPVILDAIAFHTFYGYGANFDASICWCLRFSDILEPARDWSEVKWLRDNVDRLADVVYSRHMAEGAFLQTGWLIKWFEEEGMPVHMGQLGNEHRIHQVIEQLQKRDLALCFPVCQSSWRLPPNAKAASQ
jgi:predicted HD superfamily hydrolase involved in NAD metabolism